MTLDECITELKQDIANFETEWRKENAKNPAMYPLANEDMDSNEWWEQFRDFKELGNIKGE